MNALDTIDGSGQSDLKAALLGHCLLVLIHVLFVEHLQLHVATRHLLRRGEMRDRNGCHRERERERVVSQMPEREKRE